MILYGLRLLVALLTFAVGVAAAWLFNYGPSKNCKPAAVLREGPVVTTALTAGDAPKSRSCALERSRAVEGGILQSKTIDESSPAYPHYGKVARVSGKVSVRVEVDEDGRVVKARALTGYGMLPAAAEKDALETRFPPTRLSGQAVRVTGVIMYNFVLD